MQKHKKYFRMNFGKKSTILGFSLVEILVVSTLLFVILAMMQSIYISGLKQSVKGTGLLLTIKEASDLFGSIRKDLLACTLSTVKDINGAPVFLLLSSGATFPDFSTITYGTKVEFKLSDVSTASYEMTLIPPEKYCVTRTFQKTGSPDKKTRFAVPKMKIFRSLLLMEEHLLGDSPFFTRHLIVEIVLKDDDPRAANKPIRLAFFLSPLNLGLSNWNFSYVKN
ncbi:MAG: hypothetical protein HQM08_12005 [Candidatus Riflebacteria bacterium]|nr:hypothetical protein [Candidatus Riflebacteria bacterium]